jgi:hypothetical protein
MGKLATKPHPNKTLYDTDFFEWTQEQARLLRERRWDDLDLENLIEEVKSVGGSNKREIESRLVALMAHLLKWKYQPGLRSSGWRGTISEQRFRIGLVIRDSPSLRGYPSDVLREPDLAARLRASKETGIDFTVFPEECPFTVEQVLDDDFLPKEPDLLDQS